MNEKKMFIALPHYHYCLPIYFFFITVIKTRQYISAVVLIF